MAMERIVAAALVAIAGCGLYTGDDVDPVDVDAGEASPDAAPDIEMGGTYRVTWSCQTPSSCISPLENDTLVSVADESAQVRISWAYDGALTPSAIHVGDRVAPGCVDVPLGTDEGVQRDPYQICVNPAAPAPALQATMTWGSSTWRADLTRL